MNISLSITLRISTIYQVTFYLKYAGRQVDRACWYMVNMYLTCMPTMEGQCMPKSEMVSCGMIKLIKGALYRVVKHDE